MSQSLDRGLRILDEIAAGRTTLADISESLGVHKSTVLRLLGTLQQHHVVRREDEHHYALGRRLFDLASFALQSREVVAIARPAMRHLCQATGYSVYLATYEASEAVVVEVAAGRRPLQLALRVGEVLPLHATAGGKIFGAELSGEDRVAVLAQAPFTGHTAATLTDRDQVSAEWAKVRGSGLAHEVGEYGDYINAIAAPVRDSTGSVVAAMALTAPAVGRDHDGLEPVTPRLLAACAEVSLEMGWQ